MNADHYQRLAMRTASPAIERNTELIIAALGLAGEAGEIADHLKKHLHQGHELDEHTIIEELGDLCWYVALMADALGIKLGMVLAANIAKLERRYPDGFDADRSINRDNP